MLLGALGIKVSLVLEVHWRVLVNDARQPGVHAGLTLLLAALNVVEDPKIKGHSNATVFPYTDPSKLILGKPCK